MHIPTNARSGRDLGLDDPNLPPATVKPCRECPWTRDSAAGWLGPLDAEERLMAAHSDVPIACHMTLPWDDPPWDTTGLRLQHRFAVTLADDANILVIDTAEAMLGIHAEFGPADRDGMFLAVAGRRTLAGHRDRPVPVALPARPVVVLRLGLCVRVPLGRLGDRHSDAGPAGARLAGGRQILRASRRIRAISSGTTPNA